MLMHVCKLYQRLSARIAAVSSTMSTPQTNPTFYKGDAMTKKIENWRVVEYIQDVFSTINLMWSKQIKEVLQAKGLSFSNGHDDYGHRDNIE